MNRYEQFERDAKQSTLAREAYGRYLQSLSWDYFVTVTFRHPVRDNLFAQESVWNTLADSGTERAFLAVERHRYPSRDCHVHGLAKVERLVHNGVFGPHEFYVGASSLWQDCFTRHGRARVEEIRTVQDVAAYCAKYVTKEMSDYGFYGQPKFWT